MLPSQHSNGPSSIYITKYHTIHSLSSLSLSLSLPSIDPSRPLPEFNRPKILNATINKLHRDIPDHQLMKNSSTFYPEEEEEEPHSTHRKRPTFGSWLQLDGGVGGRGVGGHPFLFRTTGDRFQSSFRYIPAFPFDAPPSPESHHQTRLLGSLVRKEGHIYSLAASGDLLYTGSESKSIRVWKNQKEFSGFKSNSGLVKAIIIAGERIFSGHQDGKIRIWKARRKDPTFYKRVGTMPTLRAMIKSSLNPNNYVEDRRHRNRNAIWIMHTDAISCLTLSEDKSFLYSASWDKTFKVWRISGSKCLESVAAHDDTVNAIVAACDGYVFTGSADGTVKVWRRHMLGKKTKHLLTQTLLNQECAVTALAVDPSGKFLYCGSSDGLVNFWECGTFLYHGGVLRGHKLAVLCLATAGDLVLSGSADTNICVWKRDGGEHVCLSVLTGHSGPVKCLVAEEDKEEKGPYWCGRGARGRHYTVYSGSSDKSVKLWKVTEAAVAAPRAPSRLPSRPYREMAEFLHGASACKVVAAAEKEDYPCAVLNHQAV